jgi:hypothetical protein
MARLIAMLGTGSYRAARYHLAGAPEPWQETRYAPVATAALTGGIADAVLLLTDDARDAHWDACRQELQALGIRVSAQAISVARDAEGMWQVFERVLTAAERSQDIVVDVTHALRHLPLVLFASLTYITAFGGVRVRGVYYGAYEASTDEGVPILDLGVLLELANWYHAARTFAETGHARRMAEALRQEIGSVFRRFGPTPSLQHLRAALEGLASSVPVGLPIEAGLAARRALDALARLRSQGVPSPIAGTVLQPLEDRLRPIAFPEAREDKASTRLDIPELRRQLEVIRWQCVHDQPDRALLLLREWVINRCLLARAMWADRWLDYSAARHPMERALNGLALRSQLTSTASIELPDRQRVLASLWSSIRDRRNAIAHAGFKPEVVAVKPGGVEGLLRDCEERCDDDATWQAAAPGAAGRLLVTPLGLSPGVLYTALAGLRPDRTLVVTSRQGLPLVEEARARAGTLSDDPLPFVVSDAHACFDEVGDLLAWARPHLLEADEALVNLTGGTTALQYLVERLAGQAARVGVPVTRYALIDRREPEDQRREPWVAGECIPLTGDEPADEV